MDKSQRHLPATAVILRSSYQAPFEPIRRTPQDPGACAGTQQLPLPPVEMACPAPTTRSLKGLCTAAARDRAMSHQCCQCDACCICRRSVRSRCPRRGTAARTPLPNGAPRLRLCGSPTNRHLPLQPHPQPTNIPATHPHSTPSSPPLLTPLHPAAQEAILNGKNTSRHTDQPLQRRWPGMGASAMWAFRGGRIRR